MDIECWTGDHYYYAKSFGIPIILIWVVSIPILGLYLLFRQRKHLAE